VNPPSTGPSPAHRAAAGDYSLPSYASEKKEKRGQERVLPFQFSLKDFFSPERGRRGRNGPCLIPHDLGCRRRKKGGGRNSHEIGYAVMAMSQSELQMIHCKGGRGRGGGGELEL